MHIYICKYIYIHKTYMSIYRYLPMLMYMCVCIYICQEGLSQLLLSSFAVGISLDFLVYRAHRLELMVEDHALQLVLYSSCFTAHGLKLIVQSMWFRASGFELMLYGSWFRAWGLELVVEACGLDEFCGGSSPGRGSHQPPALLWIVEPSSGWTCSST